MAGFFTDVAGPIQYGGPNSLDPLSYKVYQPDRLVLGKRMEEHLRIAVCLWHSFGWPGTDIFGVGTFDRPWIARRATRWTAARASWPPRSSSSRSSASRSSASTTATSRPEGRTFAERPPTSTTLVDEAGAHGADGHPPAVGHGQPVQRTRATRPARPPTPIPRSSPTRRRRSSRCSRRPSSSAARTTCSGAAARATRPCSTPTWARGAAARALPPPGRRAQAPDRLRGDAAHRAQAKGADEAPVRLRLRDGRTASSCATASRTSTGSTSRPTTPRSPATASTTRSRTRSADGIFGSIDANRGDSQNGWDTDQFPNSVDELALAVYEILRGGGFTTGGFNFDAKLRRQSMERDRPVPRPHRRHRHAGAGAARGGRRCSRTASWPRRAEAATPAGLASLGRTCSRGARRWPTWRARVARWEIEPRPVSGRPGAPRERREPAASGPSAEVGHRA